MDAILVASNGPIKMGLPDGYVGDGIRAENYVVGAEKQRRISLSSHVGRLDQRTTQFDPGLVLLCDACRMAAMRRIDSNAASSRSQVTARRRYWARAASSLGSSLVWQTVSLQAGVDVDRESMLPL